MGIRLRQRKGATGITFLMDINHNGERWYEPIKGYKLSHSANPIDKQNNKNTLKIVENIAHQRAMDLNNEENDVKVVKGNDVLVLDWMAKYLSVYDKKDKRNIAGVINRFTDFLIKEEVKALTFKKLDELLIESFVDYLQKNSVGEGASSYYKRFTKMITHAYRNKMIKTNPLDFVTKKPKGKARRKEILTLEEIIILSETPTKAKEVRRAFLFCCFTGLAWVDVKILKWRNIKLNEGMLYYERKKNEDRYETVKVDLNENSILLLGKAGEREDLVFKLPSADGANSSLKKWIIRAGIDKKITWHNARHSLGTNLMIAGADIYETANILGHSDLKMTQRYVANAKEHNKKTTSLLNIKLKL